MLLVAILFFSVSNGQATDDMVEEEHIIVEYNTESNEFTAFEAEEVPESEHIVTIDIRKVPTPVEETEIIEQITKVTPKAVWACKKGTMAFWPTQNGIRKCAPTSAVYDENP